MVPWTLLKLLSPERAAGVFGKYYLLPGMEAWFFYVVGTIQLLVLIGFALGYLKIWTYGLVLGMHALSTLTSWRAYLEPNMLFYAAWPMLAACIALFLMRDLDTLASPGSRRSALGVEGAVHP